MVERVIGRGAFGIVYKARDERLNRDVALKVPRPEALLDDAKLSRFEGEAIATASLDHPAIVPLYEAELSGATPFLASAYVPGPNLQQWLDDSPPTLSPTAAAEFLNTLAQAVQHAHEQGVVHRDLKPSNVLLSPQAENRIQDDDRPPTLGDFQPRLTDFGLARLTHRLQDTQSSMMLGTPLYMSPEQAESRNEDVGPASDVFGLGAVLYHLLTGEAPFAADSYPAVLLRMREGHIKPISEFRPDVSADLETICRKCLQADSTERYTTARELADDLQRFLSGEPIHARRSGLLQRFRRWSLQPARVSEAMLVVIPLVCVRVCMAFIGLALLVLLGETSITRAEFDEALLLHLLVTTPTEVWTIWAARRNAKRQLSTTGYRLALWISVGASMFTFLTALGIFSGSMWHQRSPGARTASFLVVSLLFMVQSVCWYIGDWRRVDYRRSGRNRFLLKRLLVGVAVAAALITIAIHFRPQPAITLHGPSVSRDFDGIDDMLVVPSVGFEKGKPYTLEAWIMPEASQRATIVNYIPTTIGVGAAGNKNYLQVLISTTQDDSYILSSETLFPNNEWTHVAVVYDTRQVKLFVNGRREHFTVDFYQYDQDDLEFEQLDVRLPDPWVLKPVWVGADVHIGALDSEVWPFKGRIGEVRLTQSEFYRGNFTPSPSLSLNQNTLFLFHLNDQTEEFTDATGDYRAEVFRGRLAED